MHNEDEPPMATQSYCAQNWVKAEYLALIINQRPDPLFAICYRSTRFIVARVGQDITIFRFPISPTKTKQISG